MHIEDIDTTTLWAELVGRYRTLEAYLEALDEEREWVSQRLMEDAISKKQKRWGVGVLKLIEEAQ